ncbi:hypothetical protein Glove_132g204 [Diversispora epigaea]|uniref:Uncharacterized protein n=1 Tax=Diversispora epigaea TaxID=1348612 RepID=A0A397J419_9GLOM|nr:hypothetical protein Glove_132g204 [Diversispora epigaea]
MHQKFHHGLIEKILHIFKLLVRGSRDGFEIKIIFNICDRVSKTIVILKVESTGEILGSSCTANMKISILSTSYNGSVYNHSSKLELSFGDTLNLKGNLKTEKRCYGTRRQEYPKPIRSRNEDRYLQKLFGIFAKVKGTDEFIDGFNPLAWGKTKMEWMSTKKNFIFSLVS